MALLNYSTIVSADCAISAIQKNLSQHGARKIVCDYDNAGNITALTFVIPMNGNDIAFRLPADWSAVLYILENEKRLPKRLLTQEHALKVSWRIIQDWIAAQMALLETRMVKMEQLFLPYAVGADGQTLFEKIERNPQLLLGSGQ